MDNQTEIELSKSNQDDCARIISNAATKLHDCFSNVALVVCVVWDGNEQLLQAFSSIPHRRGEEFVQAVMVPQALGIAAASLERHTAISVLKPEH